MQTEGVRLHVKIGGPAQKLNRIVLLKEKLNAAQSAIIQAEESLLKVRPTSPSRSKSTHSHESEAIQFVTLKRASMDLDEAWEDVFFTYQRSRANIVDEEVAARHMLTDLHQVVCREMAEKRSRDYFSSPACTYERFSLHELCVQEKMKMAQEHCDYLLSIKFAEEENRQALNLRRRGAPVSAAPHNAGIPQWTPQQRLQQQQQQQQQRLQQQYPQQQQQQHRQHQQQYQYQQGPMRVPTAPGEWAYPLPPGQYDANSGVQGTQGMPPPTPGAYMNYWRNNYNPL